MYFDILWHSGDLGSRAIVCTVALKEVFDIGDLVVNSDEIERVFDVNRGWC